MSIGVQNAIGKYAAYFEKCASNSDKIFTSRDFQFEGLTIMLAVLESLLLLKIKPTDLQDAG